jgi:hypothetical protein
MAAPYNWRALVDFTGGLNLRADQFQLESRESPDLLNVDVDPRGGVSIRRGSTRYSTTSLGADRTVTALGRHRDDAGAEYVYVSSHDSSSGRNIHTFGSGGAWSHQSESVAGAAYGRIASMKQSSGGTTYAYVQNGIDAPRRVSAPASFTALTQTFNDDIDTPNNGDMPIARLITTHRGFMWLGVTVETAVTYPHRIRWSHPGRPEDWRTNDFIDVGSDDGDVITALISDGDRLLVFKNRSIWAVYGFDTDTFQVEQISDSIGAVNQESVVETPKGVYFFHASTGVHRLWPRGLEWTFENLVPALDDGRINVSNNVYMCWAKRRLYLSVEWTPTDSRRTFAFDPDIGKNGAWVMFDLPFTALATLHGAIGVGEEAPIGAPSGTGIYITKFEQDSFEDDLDGTPVTYPSHYSTSWIDANAPTVKKKWGRLRAVLKAVADASIVVGVYYDYDSTVEKRSKTMTVEATTDGGEWDADDWDAGVWGGGEGSPYEVERNSSLGSSTAIQFRFEGPRGLDWSVVALVVPYRVRRAR